MLFSMRMIPYLTFLTVCLVSPLTGRGTPEGPDFDLTVTGWTIESPGGSPVMYSQEKLGPWQDDTQKLLQFESRWKMPELGEGDISLIVDPSSYPIEIYLNGGFVYRIGRYREAYNPVRYVETSVPLDRSGLNIPGENTLTVRAIVTTELNPLPLFRITSYSNAEAHAFLRNFIGIDLLKSSFFLGIILFIFYFFLFMTQGRQDKRYLYFSFFSLAFSLSYINMTLSFPSNNPVLLEIISRTGFALSVLFLYFFIRYFTGTARGLVWLNILLITVCTGFCFATALQRSMTAVGSFFSITMTAFIAPVLLITFVMAVIQLVKSKLKKGIPLLIAYAAILTTSIHDMLTVTALKTPYAYLTIFGFLVLVLVLFFTLAREQALLFIGAKRLAEENGERNTRLKGIMERVSAATLELYSAVEKLDERIRISSSVLQSYEENNNKIQGNLISQFSEIDAVIKSLSDTMQSSNRTVAGALENQKELTQRVMTIIESMDRSIKAVRRNAIDTGTSAEKMSGLASESARVISDTAATIAQIREIAEFIQGVLSSISDISEETNTLSINAAIEAARAGSSGKGFAVIASNIRELSAQTGTTVRSSFEKLKDIDKLVEKGGTLSSSLSGVMNTVMVRTTDSAAKIRDMAAQIEHQEREFDVIVDSVQRLTDEAEKIQDLTRVEQENVISYLDGFNKMKESFTEMSYLLAKQMQAGTSLKESMEEIREIMNKNIAIAGNMKSILES